jgi:cell division protein FtsB
MRIFAIILGLAVVLLQYRIWVSGQGMHEVVRLQGAIDAQMVANRDQQERNRQLAAEVNNLKVGLTAIEERARSELGMVGKTETFYQVVKPQTAPPTPAAEPAAHALTARVQ